MSRARRDKPNAAQAPRQAQMLDRVLFYVLLAVLAARPLIGEAFERNEVPFLEQLAQNSEPTPATVACLDTIVLITSLIVMLREQHSRSAWPLAVALATLLVAVVLSTAFAGDRHLALLAGTNLLIGALGGVALVLLVRARWMWRLLVAAALATGCTTALKCIDQEYRELPETERFWLEEQRPKLLERGFDPGDPLFVNFERRMLAREPAGFFGHPNVTASCLTMWALVACGLVVGPLSNVASNKTAPLASGVALLVAVLPGFALWLTGSLGALAAGLVGLGALPVLGFAARRLAARARAALTVMLAGYLAVIAAAAVYGLGKGTLPHPSLAFRWYYWSAAGRAFQDAPLTGLGRENFVFAYTLHKPPESTEEVRNPHNLWLSLLVETGPLGLIASVGLGMLLLHTALRRLDPPEPAPRPASEVTAIRAAPLVGGVLLVHALFSGTPFGMPGFPLIWVSDIALKWTVALLVALWLVDVATGARGGCVWIVAGLCAALLASFVHGLLSFALLTPGGLAVFVLCAAAAVAVRPAEVPAGPRTRVVVRAGAWAAGAVLVIAHVLTVSWPTIVGVRALDAARRTLHNATSPADIRRAAAQLEAAVARTRWDPSAPNTAARMLLGVGQSPMIDDRRREEFLDAARAFAAEAIRRNARDANNHAVAAQIAEQQARALDATNRPDEAQRARWHAAERWEQAVVRYPTNPRTRISAGLAWLALWKRDQSHEAARRAREHLEQALWIDDRRPPQEVQRLRPAERESIDTALRELP